MGERRHDALSAVQELEQRDAEIEHSTQGLDDALREVADIRSRAAALSRFLAELPAARTRLQETVAGARSELESARAAVWEAATALAEAEGREEDQALARARAALARADVHARLRESRVRRVEEKLEELERQAHSVSHDADELARRATEAARAFSLAAAPAGGLSELADWGTRARAELFARVAHLQREREAVVREANEMGSAALGEPLYASRISLVRAELERRLLEGR